MIKSYFKIAFRNLVRNKAYGFLNIAGLALSMACAILIFTVVQYHLSFDNFHNDKDRIYRFVTELHRDAITYTPSVPPGFGKAFRDDYAFGEKVARIATFDNEQVSLKSGKEIKKFKEQEGVSFAESAFFDIFNFPLAAGDKKTALTDPNTAVITEKLAQKYFGKESPMGQTLWLDSKLPFRITGVLKDLPVNSFQQSGVFISWPTLRTYNDFISNDNSWGGITSNMQCFSRLRPGVKPDQVEQLLPAVVTKYRPKAKNVHHYQLQPLSEMHFDARYGGIMEKRDLWILTCIGLFLIVTACVNFINLATAQALRRSREVGIRKVLGGLRQQLFRQFLAETGVIAFIAALAALGLAYLFLPYMNEWLSTKVKIDLVGDWQLLLFIPLLILLVTFLAGAYPGLVLSGFQPVRALKGRLSLQSMGGLNTRRTLIVTQFTISLVLLMAMVVITRQMQYTRNSDLGFNKDAVLMIPTGSDSVNTATKTLKARLAAIPGVQGVAFCYSAPSAEETWTTGIRFANRSEEELFRVSIKAADDQYLPVFGLQLAAGRNVFPSDSVREILVNEVLVQKLGLRSSQEAMGQKISFNGENQHATIVGVLKNFHDRSLHEDINPIIVAPYMANIGHFAVKLNLGNRASVMPALEKTWSGIHPDLVYEYQFLDDNIAAFYETEQTMLKLIRTFSFIAIFIGCLGLYGLVTFMTIQKTKEIGIRKVLGSSVMEILGIFAKEFGILIGIASLIAVPLSWWLMSTWLEDFKFHINLGPGIFILAVLASAGIAAATIGYQSIRAARMNPVKAIRTE